MWYFKKDNSRVTLVTDSGDTSLRVSGVRKLDEKDSVEVVAGQERYTLLLKDFKYDGSSFSRTFEKCVQSRTMFVKAWNLCAGRVMGDDTMEQDHSDISMNQDSGNGEQSGVKNPSTLSSDTSLNEDPDILPPIKRKKKKSSITVGKKPEGNRSTDPRESSDEDEEIPHTQGPTAKKAKTKSSTDSQAVEESNGMDDDLSKQSTGLMADSKMKGVCVPVHILNIIPPESSRKVRDLDKDHVEKLKGEFQRYRSPFLMLAGHVAEDIDLDTLKQESDLPTVEVIGGQHTCAALKELHDEGMESCSVVYMNIFKGLSDTEAIEIGFHHNEMVKLGKPLEFMDLVKLLRLHLFSGQTERERKKTKKEIAAALGFQKMTPFNRFYCKNMAVAGYSTRVFEKVLEVSDLWEKKKIAQQPKKPLNQSHLRGLFIGGINDEERLGLLDLILKKGYKAYREKTEEMIKKQKTMKELKQSTTDTGEMENQADVTEEESSVEDVSDDESTDLHPDVQPENDEDEEKDTLRQKCRELKALVDTLNKENQQLKKEVERLESMTRKEDQSQGKVLQRKRVEESTNVHPKRSTTEKKDDNKRKAESKESTNVQPKRSTTEKKVDSKRKSESEKSTNVHPKRSTTEKKDDNKRKAESEVKEWSKGDICEGYYSPEEIWYKVKVLKKISEGVYKIKYQIDNHVENLSIDLMRRL